MRTSWCVVRAVALATCLSVAEGGAQTPKYPDKPVKILVGFSAGGGTDVVARIPAQKMSEGFGQTVAGSGDAPISFCRQTR
jgi:tripartite-type tricarboxylate transporter receptor subunit TctC